MTADGSNSRVTNAILGTKLDNLTELVRRAIADADQREKRVAALETSDAVARTNWNNHKDLHRRERGLLGLGSFIGSLIAGAIGVFYDRP